LAGGAAVEVPTQYFDPDAALGPGCARRCTGHGDRRRTASARRPLPSHCGGRGHRYRQRVHRAGRRLRQGAACSSVGPSPLPGRQASLRQHAGGVRAGHRRRLGRRPGRRRGHGPALVRRGPSRPRWRWRRGTSAPTSTFRSTAASGFTWEHDAHLYLRRATALESFVDAEAAARDITDLVRDGARRTRTVDLPTRGRADARRGARLRRAGARARCAAQRDASH